MRALLVLVLAASSLALAQEPPAAAPAAEAPAPAVTEPPAATAAPTVAPGRRNAGRFLITGSLVMTAGAPFVADFNDSHIFNPDFSPHGRFHSAVLVFSQTAFSLFGLWALWHDQNDATGRLTAALVPVIFWGMFFLAILMPGTGADNPDHPVPRPLGIPVNLLIAGVNVAVSGGGWALDRYLNP